MHSCFTMKRKMGSPFQKTATLSFDKSPHVYYTINVHSIFANFQLDKMRPLFCSVRKLRNWRFLLAMAKLQSKECGRGKEQGGMEMAIEKAIETTFKRPLTEKEIEQIRI